MKGISFYFVITAAICGLIGMAWGIQMSASQDHTLSAAHAHLNLIGWVSMALFGLTYHLLPKAGESRLAKVHFALALAGVVIIVPGIVQALIGAGDTLAKIGSLLTILSMLTFIVTLVTRGRA